MGRVDNAEQVQVYLDVQPLQGSCYLHGVAEDGQVHDILVHQPARRPQDAVVVSLRQHDMLLLAPGPLHEVVLKHVRRHGL